MTSTSAAVGTAPNRSCTARPYPLVRHGRAGRAGRRRATRVVRRPGTARRSRARGSRRRARSGDAGPPTRGSCCRPVPRATRPRPSLEHDGHARARRRTRERDLEPVARSRRRSAAAGSRPPIEPTREVDVAVVVVVGGCEPASVPRRDGSDVERRTSPPAVLTTWSRSASLARLVTGIAPFAIASSRLPSRSRSTHVAPQPGRAAGRERRRTAAARPRTARRPRLRYAACSCPREFVTKRSSSPSPE